MGFVMSIHRFTTLLVLMLSPACDQADSASDAADSSPDSTAPEGAVALSETITGFSIVDADGLVYPLPMAQRTATGSRLDEGHTVAEYVSGQNLKGVWRTTSGAVRGPWLDGELSEPPVNTRIDAGVAQLVAGRATFVARTADGGVYLWANNITRPQLFDGITDAAFCGHQGQRGLAGSRWSQIVLGDGQEVVQIQRRGIRGTRRWRSSWQSNLSRSVAQIALGDEFSCILSSAGDVRCFGENDHGQLSAMARR